MRDSPQISAGPSVMKYCGLVMGRGLDGILSYSFPAGSQSQSSTVAVRGTEKIHTGVTLQSKR